MENKLIVTFTWDTGVQVSNLLPTEINRILNGCAEQLTKAAGKPLIDATFDFQGKSHNVPIRTTAGA